MQFIIACAICYGLYIHQMDVITTFLNGLLQEEVYMILSKGFFIYNKNKYGLKIK